MHLISAWKRLKYAISHEAQLLPTQCGSCLRGLVMYRLSHICYFEPHNNPEKQLSLSHLQGSKQRPGRQSGLPTVTKQVVLESELSGFHPRMQAFNLT